ncbi:MAG TPA: dihydropteroate synthase [Myxococcota bacterium]
MSSSSSSSSSSSLTCGDRRLALRSATPIVMGIVNVTPDSFSDGGRHHTTQAAIDHAQRLLDDGADVLDIGGESTRPGAAAVSVDDERARVLPVIEGLVARGITNLSIDTRRATIARAALTAGASWINDVSGFGDVDMAAACVGADATIVMHWITQDAARVVAHVDVVAEVAAWLRERVVRGVAAGIDPATIVVDPGVGFSKSLPDTIALTNALRRLVDDSGAAGVLYGPSRKRFLGTLSGRAEATDRDAATIGAVVFAALNGADIVRVHDVKGCVDALKVVAGLRG